MAKIYHSKFENKDYNPRLANAPAHTSIAILLFIFFTYMVSNLVLFVLDNDDILVIYGVAGLVFLIVGMILCSVLSLVYVNPSNKRLVDRAMYKNMLRYELLSDYDNVIADTNGRNMIELILDEVDYSFEHDKAYVNRDLGITKYYIKGQLYDTLVARPLIIPTDKIDKIEFRIHNDRKYYDYYENEVMVVYLKRGDSFAFFVDTEKQGDRNAYKAIKEILGDIVVD